MKNYLKGINQRIGNIFVNIRTLEELERKTGYTVDEEGNILEYNKNLKKVENYGTIKHSLQIYGLLI